MVKLDGSGNIVDVARPDEFDELLAKLGPRPSDGGRLEDDLADLMDDDCKVRYVDSGGTYSKRDEIVIDRSECPTPTSKLAGIGHEVGHVTLGMETDPKKYDTLLKYIEAMGFDEGNAVFGEVEIGDCIDDPALKSAYYNNLQGHYEDAFDEFMRIYDAYRTDPTPESASEAKKAMGEIYETLPPGDAPYSTYTAYWTYFYRSKAQQWSANQRALIGSKNGIDPKDIMRISYQETVKIDGDDVAIYQRRDKGSNCYDEAVEDAMTNGMSEAEARARVKKIWTAFFHFMDGLNTAGSSRRLRFHLDGEPVVIDYQVDPKTGELTGFDVYATGNA
jgi:hypothetical protein